MKIIDNIDIHQGPLGLALSGGADSAILAYILLTNTTYRINLYSFISEGKKHFQEPTVNRLVQKLTSLTGNNNIEHYPIYIQQQKPLLIHAMMKSFIQQHSLNIMYTGMTKFPEDTVIDQFSDDIRLSDPYGYSQRRNDRQHSVYFDQNFYRPFANNDKTYIKDLYKKYNLEHDLFVYTRSCETPESPDKHCGKCFWCEERHWAFGYLE